MNLRHVAAVSGKPGLHKVVKPTRTGVILETLDDSKKRWVANASHRVSILREISVYVMGEESSILLEDLYSKMKEEYGFELPVGAKDDNEKLKSFLEEVLPDYDRERVYVSDIKKMVSWFNIVATHAPEFFDEASEDEQAQEEEQEG